MGRHGLVFASETGTPLDAANVRRGFRRIATEAGLHAADWTPRELRHSFVSLLSDHGVPIEQIARLVGHTGGSTVTETVYRKQLRPVIEDGAPPSWIASSDAPLTARWRRNLRGRRAADPNSDSGQLRLCNQNAPIEQIARLAGPASHSTVTKTAYHNNCVR